MLDNMSDGRAHRRASRPAAGRRRSTTTTPAAIQREQFWEAVDLIEQRVDREGPFAFEGRHYPLRYVNPWPQPQQQPHPPIWIPGSQSKETMRQFAQRGHCYFLSSRVPWRRDRQGAREIQQNPAGAGHRYDPFRMGILMSAYVVGDRRAGARGGARGCLVLPQELPEGPPAQLPGPLDDLRAGVPYVEVADYRRVLENTKPGRPMLGDADDWDALIKSQSIIVGSPDTVYRADHRSGPRNRGRQPADPVPHG